MKNIPPHPRPSAVRITRRALLLIAALAAPALAALHAQTTSASGDYLVQAQIETRAGERGDPPKMTGNKRVITNLRSAREAKALAFANFPGAEHRNKPLLVMHTAPDEKFTAQIEEDLAVMSRVLDRAAGQSSGGPVYAAGIAIEFNGSRPIRTVYLQDYGVLFTLNVPFPLRAGPEPKEKVASGDSSRSEEWEAARDDLFGGQRKEWVPGHALAGHEFNEDQVRELEEDLIKSLKNAANIRNLKDNEYITIVVRGQGTAGEAGVEVFDVGLTARADRVWMIDPNTGLPGHALGGQSTLVLRAAKGDIDLYAKKGGLSLDQFRQRLTRSLY